ncbi:thiol:disulfide interchange protein DsbA/DsbL [Aestuariibacter sp. AA17]|uniref:Thiol:disulfide interchange protein n=1 Tax=Fluctibacter corallii TaxID=2984329 RepID=A0ABT3A7X3_9ALTE|nr:thiol:disulfide interchange protein DsbA/DsbL [Aestuariibacter sp. AA17]MCV2884775.1 thiol:disulfide interchange protein DsbA/DsbL [Aestuariibacter sp. AA17]
MLKIKHISLVVMAMVLSFSTLANAKWEEGTHYDVISEKATKKKEVMEIFSFWCPSCFRFEPLAKQIKSTLPDDVKFVKAHVDFLAYADNQTQNDATLLMLAARAMKDEERFNQALFDAIHKNGTKPDSIDALYEIYANAGGDVDKMKKLAKSFGIKSQFNMNKKRVAGTRSVPTFIINGKYRLKITRDMTPDEIVEAVIWLTSQK